jgi:hypothetical protein
VLRAVVVRYLKRRKRSFCRVDKCLGVWGCSFGSVRSGAVVGSEGTVVL